jgi:predicted DNA-binding antitoxin AbrB/MazE fold protein
MTTLEAIYENGAFHPITPVRLPNGTRVQMTVALQEEAETKSSQRARFSWQDRDFTQEDLTFNASEELIRQRAEE